MLERTAAKLEPCSLPRSLPSTVRPRRNLHTGFWQHGAAALDLSGIWASPLRAQQSDADTDGDTASATTSARRLPERLLTSAFLLDFLYPKGTAAFLRRLTPAAVDRSVPSAALPSASPSRLFTSSARSVVDTDDTPRYLLEHSVQISSRSAQNGLEGSRLSKKGEQTREERKKFLAGLQAVVDPDAAHRAMTPAQLMSGLMAKTDTEFYGPIWELWLLLHPGEKASLRKDVLKYLHHSPNPTDAERVLIIFSELDLSAWSPSQVMAAVAAHLRLGEVESALQLYLAGLRGGSGFVGGMGHLLQHAFSTSDWQFLTRIYDPWQEASSTRTEKLTFGTLTPLLSIPNLGARVLAFRKALTPDEIPDETTNQMLRDPEASAMVDQEAELDAEQEDPAPVLYPSKSPEERLDFYDPLLRVLAKLAIQQPCHSKDALALLHLASDEIWYYKYLTAAIERGDTDAFAEVYRDYRQLPTDQFRPTKWMLGSILQAFIPYDVQGVEMIYEDFHTLFGGLTPFAYGQFVHFYASRGDVESTQQVWDAFMQGASSKKALQNPKTFVPLLNAHKQRGDVNAVRRVFADLTAKYGINPDITCWNILLASVVSLGDVATAQNLFGKLCKTVRPNATSFGTIMAMTARRGDLGLTLELLDDAQRRNVAIDAAMTAAVVDAYCRNDQFQMARRVCRAAAKEKLPGNHTVMWNCLIRRKSHERDLRGVYTLINSMPKYKVPLNNETEEAVLQALARARRVGEAYGLLRSAVKMKSFPVTDRHYSVVIEGALRVRQWTMVLALCRQMEDAGFVVSGKNQIARVTAEAFTTRTTDQPTEMGEQLISHFEQILHPETQQTQPHEPGTALRRETADYASEKYRTEFVHKAVESLLQVSDLPAARKLLGMYADGVIGPSASRQDLPLPILASTMRADLMENMFNEVKETWNVAWDKARQLGKPSSGEPNVIVPAFQYSLSIPLGVMQEVQVVEGDAKALLMLVNQMETAGFVLNSLDWNTTCLNLAKLGEWVQACLLFEQMLMPRWTGWKAKRIVDEDMPNNAPYEQRLLGQAAEYLRPNAKTLTFLTDEFHKLRRHALWDTTCDDQLIEVSAQCPRLTHAFKTALGHNAVGLTYSSFHHHEYPRSDEQ